MYGPWGNSGGSVPNSTSLGQFVKSLGVTKMAGVAWGSVEITVSLVGGPLKAAQKLGVQTVLTDLSASPTTTDYTAEALAVKSSGAQGLWSALDGHSLLALGTAISQQNVHLKAAVYASPLYEQSTLTDPEEPALEGSYVQYWFKPLQVKDAATAAYKAALAKYAPGNPGGFYATEGYLEADLLIQAIAGVKGAITTNTVGAAMKSLTDYTGAGLIPRPLNFSLPKTATQNQENCFWYVKIKNKQFVSEDAAAICG
jgi:ABC-type branched-subunit amino acid transport system substrate-binding protein